MKLKSLLLILAILPLFAVAQSKTTEALAKKYTDSQAFFFYQNTLRMLNQTEDKAFDELIKDIEKLKLLLIKKTGNDVDAAGYKKIVNDYKTEEFEELMTSRFEGKNFDIFMKSKDGKTKGMLVLVNDSSNLYVLDIVGSIAMNKVTDLYKTIDSSSDIGQKIKAFSGAID
jgi:hypothetical protein